MTQLQKANTNQVIENEQEAQNEDNNLVEIDLSLEAQAILAYSHRVYNRDKILAELKRANPHTTKQKHKKSFLLCSQAQKLFKTVMHKLQTQKRVLLNSKYISKITGCDSTDQNKRIMGQLDYLLKIEYHRLAIVDGTPYNYHYSFELQPAIIEELKDVELWNLKSMPALMRLSYNNIPNTSNRSIRSRANFSNTKNSNSKTSNTELEETKNLETNGSCVNYQANQQSTESIETPNEPQVVETQNPKAATITPIQTKARPANKRKTKTREEQKQRKAANVVRNGFLGKGKSLSEIQPYLTDEICKKLRSGSGRDFTNKAIREITKAIAASDKGSKAIFQHVNGIVAYLTPALANEKRDPNKISGEGYYTLAGMTEEDNQLHKQENYLNQIENSGIHARCDYTQFRARIAGQFPINLAYNLLTSMIGVKRQENVLKLTMHKQVPLSQHYKQLLLKHATGVGGYAGVSELEFVVIASNSNIRPEKALSCERQTSGEEPRSLVTYPKGISQSTDSAPVRLWEELQLTEGIWDKVCSSFISEYGENGQALYSHWLAPLSVVEKDGIIELSTNSDMVRDRIEQTYLPFLVKLAGEFGINKVEFVI